MEYQVADEVKKVAEPLIKNYHSHLNGAEIVYLFQNKRDRATGAAVIPKSKGRPVLGMAKLVTGLNAFLVSGATRTDGDEIDPFFVLLITKPAWDRMKAKQREALVDHELCHMGVDDETGKPTLLPHDLEEFNAVVRRHGIWQEDVEAFFKAAKQIPLPLEAKKAAVKKASEKNGNGKAAEAASSAQSNGDKPNGVEELKKEVARRRGGSKAKPAAATK